MGLDAKVSDSLTAGLLFSYQHTYANLDLEGSHSYVNSYTGGVYAGWHDSGFFANGLADLRRQSLLRRPQGFSSRERMTRPPPRPMGARSQRTSMEDMTSTSTTS